MSKTKNQPRITYGQYWKMRSGIVAFVYGHRPWKTPNPFLVCCSRRNGSSYLSVDENGRQNNKKPMNTDLVEFLGTDAETWSQFLGKKPSTEIDGRAMSAGNEMEDERQLVCQACKNTVTLVDCDDCGACRSQEAFANKQQTVAFNACELVLVKGDSPL